MEAQAGVTSSEPSAATVDFGPVPLGQERTLTLALNNTGEAVLTILKVDQSKSDPEFTVDIAEGVQVQSGVPLSIPIHFTPFSVGQKSGTVVLDTDSSDVPQVTLSLTGQGVKLAVTVTPEGIDFGKVVIHTTATQNVTIANGSTLAVTLAISAIQGAQANLFSQGSLTPALTAFSLAGGQTVTLPVSYAPVQVASAPDTAFLTVGYCQGCAAITVNLRGEPVDTGLSVTPNPLNFGFDPPNQPITQVIKLSNVANRPIHMTSSPIVNPGNPAAYALAATAPTFPLLLAPNSSTDVPVVFTPPGLAQFTGSITFTSDDPQASEVVVNLTGFGGGAQIQCLPRLVGLWHHRHRRAGDPARALHQRGPGRAGPSGGQPPDRSDGSDHPQRHRLCRPLRLAVPGGRPQRRRQHRDRRRLHRGHHRRRQRQPEHRFQ